MNSTDAIPRLVRRPEACRHLAIGATHLYKLTCSGELTAIRRGRRLTLYDVRELDQIADRWAAEARASQVAA